MKKNIFGILSFSVIMAYANTASAVEQCATIIPETISEGVCSSYDSSNGQSTSIVECYEQNNSGTWVYFDIIGTCGSTYGTNAYIAAPVTYSATLNANTTCYCKLLTPYVSDWVALEVSFSNYLDCNENCGYLCSEVLASPDSFPDTLENLFYNLYR